MTHEQLTLQLRENENLTKRNQNLYDQYTRVDIECNRVSEDLLSANNRVEQLRNESANLRAEKKIWEVGTFSAADDKRLIHNVK
jgi:nucleoprotein TPR